MSESDFFHGKLLFKSIKTKDNFSSTAYFNIALGKKRVKKEKLKRKLDASK